MIALGEGLPSRSCIAANAQALARYAALCQEAGLVPIVEPEVLMTGGHGIERCLAVTETVLRAVFQELEMQDVAGGGDPEAEHGVAGAGLPQLEHRGGCRRGDRSILVALRPCGDRRDCLPLWRPASPASWPPRGSTPLTSSPGAAAGERLGP